VHGHKTIIAITKNVTAKKKIDKLYTKKALSKRKSGGESPGGYSTLKEVVGKLLTVTISKV
jgi:hypothetical protein